MQVRKCLLGYIIDHGKPDLLFPKPLIETFYKNIGFEGNNTEQNWGKYWSEYKENGCNWRCKSHDSIQDITSQQLKLYLLQRVPYEPLKILTMNRDSHFVYFSTQNYNNFAPVMFTDKTIFAWNRIINVYNNLHIFQSRFQKNFFSQCQGMYGQVTS